MRSRAARQEVISAASILSMLGRWRLIGRVVLAVLLASVCGACGGGDSFHPSPSATPRGPDPTPSSGTGSTPQPTAAPSPAATPDDEPTPTPQPTDLPEALVAVQVTDHFSDQGLYLGSETVVLRYDGDDWRPTEGPFEKPLLSLWGTTFSSPTVAWAYGSAGGDLDTANRAHPALLRSDDGGLSWGDVSATIDVGGNRQAYSMVFSDAAHGWIVTPPVFTNPVVEPASDTLLVTADGGRTFVAGGVCFGVRLCAGEALCRFSDTPLGPAPGSEAYCAPNVPELPLPQVSYTLRTFDLRYDGSGVACGDRRGRAFCLYTRDGGRRWQESALPSDLDPALLDYVMSVVLTDDGGAWATVQGSPDWEPYSGFIRSDDGGASWRRFGGMRRDLRLFGLSRSTAVADRGYAVTP